MIAVPVLPDPEVDPPRTVDQHPAVAIGAQRPRLIEVDDRQLGAGAAAEPDSRELELALLSLQVGGQRLRLGRSGDDDLEPRLEPEHPPRFVDPWAGGDHESVTRDPALRGEGRRHLPLVKLEPDHLNSLVDRRAGGAGLRGEVAYGLHRVRPAGPALVQDRRDLGLPVRPGEAQVLVAAIRPGDQLRLVAGASVVLMDRRQVVDLALGDGCDVADLSEAVRVWFGLEDLDRAADQLGDRRRAVVVAHDSSGDPRRAGADPVLLQHQHLALATEPLGETGGDGEAVDAPADDQVRDRARTRHR